MFNNQFIFSKIKFLIFFLQKKNIFLIWMVYGMGSGISNTRRVPDGYRDGTINLYPSGIGYEYEDMLGSRSKGLGRQYSYLSRPIAMSMYIYIFHFISHLLYLSFMILVRIGELLGVSFHDKVASLCNATYHAELLCNMPVFHV